MTFISQAYFLDFLVPFIFGLFGPFSIWTFISFHFFFQFFFNFFFQFLTAILHCGLKNDFFCQITYFFFHILFGLFGRFSIWTFIYFFVQFQFHFCSISVQFLFRLSFYIPVYLLSRSDFGFLPKKNLILIFF